MAGCYLQIGRTKQAGCAMSEQTSFKQRLLAVLDFDGIPYGKRGAHIANVCGCSRSTAHRWLAVESDTGGRIRGIMLVRLADWLSVNERWLYDGTFNKFDPRTARIQLSKIEHLPHDEIEMDIAPLLSGVEGEPDYVYCGYKCTLIDAMLFELRRRMTKWERNKQLRMAIRYLNNDAKVLRLSEMCARGQITRMQLFSMM